MIATSKEDGKWSDRKMVGDDGFRTVECLRGRLLAERQASRIAKEDAELMGNKLMELNNRLKEEIKLKDRAEKKLKFLKSKLESLKICSIPVESVQSSSSENSEISCRPSMASSTSSGSNDPEAHEPKPKVTDSKISEELSQNVADSTTSEQSHESLFTEENTSTAQSTSTASTSSSSIECPSPAGSSLNPSHKSEDSNSYSTLKPSMEEIENENENGRLDHYVDNTLALVPASMPATSHTKTDLKPVSESVRQVFDALRNIREELQSSMEKRHGIRIGPDQTQTCK